MHYHVCKFSRAVKHSYLVPAPHYDAQGFITAILHAISDAQIDLIIPLHEEIFYLAESQEPEITNRLLAPEWSTLLELHNKWTFSGFLASHSLAAPKAFLCSSPSDVRAAISSTKCSWAVKPVFGRAATHVYHLQPHDDVPEELMEDLASGNQYIAQEWLTGQRYCSYMVARAGKIQAFGLYPVVETIDGSSCVYFRSVAHPEIEQYCSRVAAALPGVVAAQLAFDFIDTPQYGVVAIECNPRATSGIHLFSGTTLLAQSLVTGPPAPKRGERYTTFTVIPPQGTRRQLAPGMMMWKKSERGLKAYLAHMKRLMGSKDVVFSGRDLLPSLMQPFLLTSYYEICRERKMKLPDMFQDDVVWEPRTSLTMKGKGGQAGLREEGMRDSVMEEDGMKVLLVGDAQGS
jgi:hypothetical protein